VVLTDSGTSALVLALRLMVGKGGTIAFPGYCCINLTAAALRAGVRVRLYDLDPATLSPDLESVERAIGRGVDAVLVAHLYGFPADVVGVAERARRAGVDVIEDAAEGSGGARFGRPLGGYGPLSVLSFGRGKGVTGGGGGALLALDASWAARLEEAAAGLGRGGVGWRELAAASAHWLLGRPALYWIPASIPALKLGEMVYHPAHEPRGMPAAAAALVWSAIEGADAEVAVRRRNARALEASVASAVQLAGVRAVAGGRSGYLRLPVVDFMGRASHAALGILRGYPRPLSEQAELRPCLHDGETGPPGSALLARSLLTLPTHSLVSPRDVAGVRSWIEGNGLGYGKMEAPVRAASGDQPRRLSGWLS
jgi:dTDP-4-amino-4,6-dideoxygalactose transaminase